MKSRLVKVYKRDGMNCIDLNNTYTYLPNDLSLVNAEYIEGEFYIRTIIVKTTV